MATASAELLQFFSDSNQKDPFISGRFEGDRLKPVRESIAARMVKTALPAPLVDKLISQMDELLQLDLRAVILSALCSSGKLKQYLDPAITEDEIILVPLTGQRVRSVHHPAIEPVLNGTPLGQIDFIIELQIALGESSLKIRGGMIKELSIGAVDILGKFKYGDHVIVEKQGTWPGLRGAFSLGQGLALNAPVEDIHRMVSQLRASV